MRFWTRLLLTLVVSSWLEALPLFWWEPDNNTQNFGDQLSAVLIERMVNTHVQKAFINDHKVLGIGSILHFARDKDVVWGSGINGKHLSPADYKFNSLEVRAVRGPLTRMVLQSLGVNAPAIYGDPGLLFARFFPEFRKNPIRDFLIVIHSSEENRIPRQDNIVFSTDPWPVIVQKIVESKLVISSSLHGLVIAESYGIPARFFRITQNEPLFKYADYYLGTGRKEFQYAKTIKQALQMGGEKPPLCDLDQLLDAFPYELFRGNL